MTAPTTRETADHAELALLAEAATPGPWKACGTIYEHMNCEVRGGAKGEGQAIAQVWDGPNAFRDGQFIAAANPAIVLALLSEIAALTDYGRDVAKEALEYRRQRDELRKALAPFAAMADKFCCWSVVEVCAPEPGNKSPVIQPLPLSAFETAAALITNQGADQ